MIDPEPKRLSGKDLEGMILHVGAPADARRDLHIFVGEVRGRGVTRTVRDNAIPKAAAKRLAKLLSFPEEATIVLESGRGLWSEHVSTLALTMGLVSYDTEGSYAGYSSTEPSFPDNQIGIDERAVARYLALSPKEKERAVLEAHLRMTKSEFFEPPPFFPLELFDTYGSATGPAGRMDLVGVRRRLLGWLAGLESGVWYDTRSIVAAFGRCHPRGILASAEGTGAWDTGDLYRNFRESRPGTPRYGRGETQLTEKTKEVYYRVEGRYMEWFLCGIPYQLGYVDLAERPPEDPHGTDIAPPRERIRGLRVAARLRQVLEQDPELDRVRVSVLPTFEVIVEASSYPETVLEEIERYAERLSEDGPVHRFRITRERVVRAVADDPDTSAGKRLEKLAGTALPPNVTTELASWARRGEALTVYEGVGLLEVAAGASSIATAARDAVGDLTVDAGPPGMAILREPAMAFDRLERAGLVPVRVIHQENRFAKAPGRFEGAKARPGKAAARAPVPTPAMLAIEDLVCVRSDCPELLTALSEDPRLGARPAPDGGLLLPAARLPAFRAAVRRLAARFAVEWRSEPLPGPTADQADDS